MAHPLMMRRCGVFLLLATAILWLVPASGWACHSCTSGFINLAFPFLDSGLIILGTWRVLYAIWQWHHLRPTTRKAGVAIAKRAALLLFLYGCALEGGILIYLLASFAKAIVRYVRFIAQRQAGSTVNKSVLTSVHAAVLVVLVPVAASSYVQLVRADDLERLVRYVYPGTGPSRGFALRIAKDPDFDLERLRPMLLSRDFQLQDKAYEILRTRRNVEDLWRFLDVLMLLDDNEFQIDKSHVGWLPLWIAEFCGYDKIKSKAQLREWLDRNPRTPDQPSPPQQPPPGA